MKVEAPRSRTEAQILELRPNSGHPAISIQAAYIISWGLHRSLRLLLWPWAGVKGIKGIQDAQCIGISVIRQRPVR